MMFAVPVVMLALLPAAFAPPVEKVRNPALRAELMRMRDTDQEARRRVLRWMQAHATTDDAAVKASNPPVVAEMNEIDRRNITRMRAIVAQYGWPGRSLVGKDASEAAWLLVQHADTSVQFQQRCLALLIPAARAGEAAFVEVAYLTDRVRKNLGQNQVYGTQTLTKDNKIVPWPVKDPANLDARRKAVGLPPEDEYLRQVTAMVTGHAP